MLFYKSWSIDIIEELSASWCLDVIIRISAFWIVDVCAAYGHLRIIALAAGFGTPRFCIGSVGFWLFRLEHFFKELGKDWFIIFCFRCGSYGSLFVFEKLLAVRFFTVST
jgi:hypothetical protein